MAKVALFGLGPVGLATAYQLVHRGHEVHAFDTDQSLVSSLAQGQFTRAKDLAEELTRFQGRLLFYHESLNAIPKVDVRVICVGTPSTGSDLDYRSLLSVFEQTLDSKLFGGNPNYILRSTLRPGTIDRIVLPLLSRFSNANLSYYPEFLREKFIREDLKNPSLNIVCHSGQGARALFHELFSSDAKELTNFTEAEAIKIFSNAFHSLKVTFANEVSDLCEELFIDGENVMKILCSDHKLNISEAYLKPGGPFSGHCLEKDLKCLESFIVEKQLDSPLLMAIRKSNDLRKQNERFSGDA